MADTVADRNNNPLNLKLGGATAQYLQSGDAEVGDPATDGGHFLKFKDPETGMGAARNLLFNGMYKDLDLETAMRTWSGKGYGAEVAPNLEGKIKLSELNPDQQNYLVGAMAKREGYGGTAGPATPPHPEVARVVPPFNELAKQLDPMMSKEDYDFLREKYFRDMILPKIGNPTSVPTLWKSFQDQTERQPLLGTMEKNLLLPIGLATSSAIKAMAAPLAGFGMDQSKIISEQQELEQLAAREGISTKVPNAIGTLTGFGLTMEAALTMFGPLATQLASGAFTSARTVSLAARALKGGMAFATYEAGADQEGNRLMAGLKGFGIGAGGELLLGLPAFLKNRGVVASIEEGKVAAESMLQGKEVAPEVNKAASEYLQNQQVVAKTEGRPNVFLDPDSKQKGLFAIVEGPDGHTVPFQVLPGKEDAAMNGIQQLLDKGGSLDTLQWDADNHARGAKFLRQIADQNNLKYDASVLLRTNQAPAALVDELAKKGVASEVKPNGQVSVPVQNIDVPPQIPKTPTDLPPGVDFIGQQKDETGKVLGDLYNLDIGRGSFKPTFVIKPGDDITAKIAAVKARFQVADTAETNAAAQSVADTAKESGQMPKMSYQQAQLLVRRFGMDPAKADIDAIMYMGETELNRLIETVQAQRAVRVGPEASVAEESRRLNPETKLSSSEITDPTSKEVNFTPVVGVSRREGYSMMSTGRNLDATFYYVEPGANEGMALTGKVLEAKNKIDALTKLGMTPEEAFPYTGFNKGDVAVDELGPEGVVKKFQEGGIPFRTSDKADRPLILKAKEAGYDFVRLTHEGSERGLAEELIHLQDRNTSLQKLFPMVGGEPHPSTGLGEGRSLVDLLGFDREKYSELNIPVQGRPGQVRAVIPHSLMDSLSQFTDGSAALTYANWQDALKELGVAPEQIKALGFPNSPMVVFREGVIPSTVYHEGIHTNLVNAGMNPMKYIGRDFRTIAAELTRGLGQMKGYDTMKFDSLLDEVFTYGAQAIRFDDEKLMNKLAAWDTSKRHVVGFINDTSHNMLLDSYNKLDSPGVRIFQRRLNDLIRRTDDNIFYWAKQGVGINGEDAALLYEPKTSAWSLPMRGGVKISGYDLNTIWDHIYDHDMSDYTSDSTFWAQARGLRGGITAGNPPGKSLPMAETPLTKGRGFGWLAVSGWFRPFLPWVSSLDKQLQEVAATKGVSFPLFERVKAVDNAVRTGDAFLTKWTEKFGDELSNWTSNKQSTLLNMLSYDPADWEKAAGKLNVGSDELASVGKMAQHLKDFKDETGINAMEYLRNYFPTLKANAWQTDTVPGWGILKNTKNQGFWEKSINTGELDPSDEHAGRFLKWMIRQGYEKNFTGTPLKELSQLLDLKASDGQYILGAARWPVENYVKYMRGIPDASAQAITRVIGDFQGFVSDRFGELNKNLPDGLQLPTDFGTPKQTMNRLMLLSYASGLALRPAVAIRDALQVLITGFPVIGPSSFGKGLTRALTREGWDLAENSGALLRKTNIGEMYGDIFNEMPLPEKGLMDQVAKLSQKLLGPSRWGNNLARAAVFNGVFDDALTALEKFKSGAIDQEQFLRDSHLWFTDDQVYTKFLVRAGREGVDAGLAKDIALELVDSTQWAYRRGTQPAMLKTGLGRMLGQYGNWPLNYADYVTRLGRKYSAFPDKAMASMGLWAGVNFAASKAMEGIGADSSKWLWTSPASFTGGPQLDLLQDLATSIRTDEEGASARARVLRYPLNFIPGSIATRSIITAMEGNEDMSILPPGRGFIRALGFKPLDQVNNDPDYISYALEKSGITANPFKGRR